MRVVNIDIDGVLADFNSQYRRITGHEFSKKEDSKVKWERLRGRENLFYKFMPSYIGAAPFVDRVRQLLPQGTYLRILSALPSVIPFPNAYNEKIDWVAMRIGSSLSVCIAANSEDKQNWARSGDILIDDNPLNVSQWDAKGGIAILHEDFDTSLAELKDALGK